MRSLTLAALILVACTVVSRAALPRDVLEKVSARPQAGARLDPAVSAADIGGHRERIGALLAGKPGLLLFADYTCSTLCGTELVLLSASLRRSQSKPSDFHVIVFSINPKNDAASGLAMERAEVPRQVQPFFTFLLPDEATIARATRELGFHYAYDRDIGQFAHPAAVYVLKPGGEVQGILSPFDLTTADLSSVLNAPASGSLYGRFLLTCYALAPDIGAYAHIIVRALKGAAILTIIAIGGAIFALLRVSRRASP